MKHPKKVCEPNTETGQNEHVGYSYPFDVPIFDEAGNHKGDMSEKQIDHVDLEDVQDIIFQAVKAVETQNLIGLFWLLDDLGLVDCNNVDNNYIPEANGG